ncbi:GIP, partial [Symbiodinium microadriaticum]
MSNGCLLSDAPETVDLRHEFNIARPETAAIAFFKWNNRDCTGSSFHVNVLNNDKEEVLKQLDAGVDIDAIYRYETVWQGNQQFCTGKAIHLAASRGHLSMVELLLQRRADLHSVVTRDGETNYEVIHAAVFKEGRGGCKEMIDALCARRADVESRNANHWTCLHVAYQSGNMATIWAVQCARARKCGFDDAALEGLDFVRARQLVQDALGAEAVDEDGVEVEPDPSDEGGLLSDLESAIRANSRFEELQDPQPGVEELTPLELGIREAKMNTKDLADAAPATVRSLQAFASGAPECIPLFLNRLSDGSLLRMADQLSHTDIARLVRRYPESAAMLLDMATVKARATDPEWHPLPQRVHFRESWDGVQSTVLCEMDKHWVFNETGLEFPKWHWKILPRERVRSFTYSEIGPHLDANIRVCHVPNIISPNVFAALISSVRLGDAGLCLYESSTLRAAVSYTFDHGDGVVADWMIAKGFVDLCLEVAEVFGRIRTGELRGYFNIGNAWDLLRSIIPIALLAFHSERWLHLLVVLIYWMRLLESVILSEWIGCALLPLQKLLTLWHATRSQKMSAYFPKIFLFYGVGVTADHLWPTTVFRTFATLITQGLPEHEPEDGLELLVLYGGVLFFSIFVLNIFIGVIDEEYKNEKELSHLRFLGLRASSCLTYLLRVRVIPCGLLGAKAAFGAAFAAMIAALTLQASSILLERRLMGSYQLLAFQACQLIIFLAPFQCEDGPWTDRFAASGKVFKGYRSLDARNQVRRYIWIIEPRDLSIREGAATPGLGKTAASWNPSGGAEMSQLLAAMQEATQ